MFKKYSGFTIVELLIVIVVIGILAAITIVAFNGVSGRAQIATLKSDLKNGSTQLGIYNTENGSYPSTASDLKKSATTTLQYTASNNGYCLAASLTSKPSVVYHISSAANTIEEGSCPTVATNANCFAFSAGSITDYYENEGNNPSNPACPRDLVIPAQINGTAVTSIASYALYTILDGDFEAIQLTSLTLPSSLTSIGEAAFSNNLLTSLTIPSSVTNIGSYAFAGNSLTSVSVPTATTIGTDAFDAGVTINTY